MSFPRRWAVSPQPGGTGRAGATRGGDGEGTRAGNAQPSAAADLLLRLQLLGGKRQGGRKIWTLGASEAAGRGVGAGGSRDGDAGIGKQILQPTGLSETLPRPPPRLGQTLLCWGEQGLGEDMGVTPVRKPCQSPAGTETAAKEPRGSKSP